MIMHKLSFLNTLHGMHENTLSVLVLSSGDIHDRQCRYMLCLVYAMCALYYISCAVSCTKAILML